MVFELEYKGTYLFKSWGSNQITDIQIFSTNEVILAQVVTKQVFFSLLKLCKVRIDGLPIPFGSLEHESIKHLSLNGSDQTLEWKLVEFQNEFSS